MKGRKPNENDFKEFYKNRKHFNNYVNELLGKDALLHEISHNSDSSSSSNNPFDFLNKPFKPSPSPSTIYNDYYNSSKTNKSITKTKDQPDPSNQSIILWKQAKTIIKEFMNKKQIEIRDIDDHKLLQIFGDTVNQKVIENSNHHEQSSKVKAIDDVIIQLDSRNMSSFYNMQFDEIKQQISHLKQQNKKLKEQMVTKQDKIRKLELNVGNSSINPSSIISQSKQKSENDLLKKIAKIRHEEIIDLQAKNRDLHIYIESIKLKLSDYKKVIVYAKKLNQEFITEYEAMHSHSPSGQYQIGMKSMNVQSMRNSRFKFIRAKTVPNSGFGHLKSTINYDK